MEVINVMISFSIRFDETTHRKLKVIAAYENKSINALILDVINAKIKTWQEQNGEIKALI